MIPTLFFGFCLDFCSESFDFCGEKVFDLGNVLKLREVLPVLAKQMFNVRFELTFEGKSDALIRTFLINSVVVSSVLLVALEKKLFRKLFIVFF